MAATGPSRTPVREALLRLKGTDLVRVRPRHGYVVTPLSEDLVNDVYDAFQVLAPAMFSGTASGGTSPVVGMEAFWGTWV